MREFEFQILKKTRLRLKSELEELEEKIAKEEIKRTVLKLLENIKEGKKEIIFYENNFSDNEETEEQKKAHLFKEFLKLASKK